MKSWLEVFSDAALMSLWKECGIGLRFWPLVIGGIKVLFWSIKDSSFTFVASSLGLIASGIRVSETALGK